MNLTGKLLISMPSLEDERFYKTVIYMCAHSSEGSMGIIINKPFNDKTINDIFDQISDNFDQINDDLSNLYFGGPVYIDRAILLHDKNIDSDKSIKISNDLFISTYKKKLEDMSKTNKDTTGIHYSEWYYVENGKIKTWNQTRRIILNK